MKKSDPYCNFGHGGEIPYTGKEKEIMDKFHAGKLKDASGHTIVNPKQAVMEAFSQCCRGNHKEKYD